MDTRSWKGTPRIRNGIKINTVTRNSGRGKDCLSLNGETDAPSFSVKDTPDTSSLIDNSTSLYPKMSEGHNRTGGASEFPGNFWARK